MFGHGTSRTAARQAAARAAARGHLRWVPAGSRVQGGRAAAAERHEGTGMKVYVRHGDGELMFPSFKDFQAMYRLKFVSPDDLVRRENSDRWIRAKDLPELRAMHLYDRPETQRRLSMVMWLVTAAFAAMILVRLFLLQSHPH